MKTPTDKPSGPMFTPALITHCPGDNNVVWRYMDLARFISLLENQAIYFCPSDQLGDPLEGSLTYQQQMMRWMEQGNGTRETLDRSDPFFEQHRRRFCVSCWHLSRTESNAMWQLYSHVNKGIAIRSTIGRLKRSITNFSGEIFLGVVDYSEKASNYTSLLARLYLKRKAYSYEREFRALIIDRSEGNNAGIGVPVDLRQLILSVVLSPFCEPWVRELVSQLLRRYGLSFRIEGGLSRIIF